MKLILKKAKIIDPAWNKEKKRFDIAIRNGKIEKIAASIQMDGYKTITSKNLHVSIGFFDIGTQIGEPGLEHREDLDSISKAAEAGGYTGIAPFPNNLPVTQSKSEILFITNNTEKKLVDFHPIGAVSRNTEGEDITEFIDMHRNGSIAFSDGHKSIADAGLMLRALQYAKAIDALVINHPDIKTLSGAGQIHEGKVSVSLGLEGIPEMSEYLGLQRDVTLCDYAESKYCAYNISAKSSIDLLKSSKNASATVSYLNLLFEDKDVLGFDVNLKVKPPLRTSKDRKALIKALKKDLISAITSGHQPLEEEAKKKSFAFADYGAIGIETVFPAINSALNEEILLDKIIEKLTQGPREVLGLSIPEIKEGREANLCIFDPTLEWTYTDVKSKSKNSPFLKKQFKGKVLGVINNKKFSE